MTKKNYASMIIERAEKKTNIDFDSPYFYPFFCVFAIYFHGMSIRVSLKMGNLKEKA